MAGIVENKDITRLNTFGIRASAGYFAEFRDAPDLRDIFSRTYEKWHVLGGGSNILFTEDYRGLLLHPVSGSISETEGEGSRIFVKADAGVVWDALAEHCAERGWWGLENLSGIPGTVGAAPVQNIGAYGMEVGEAIKEVEYYDVLSGKPVVIEAQECLFGYRDSIFKHALKGRAVILSVTFSLSSEGDPRLEYGALRAAVGSPDPSPGDIRRAVLSVRGGKLPDPETLGNAGSFFRNPSIDSSLAESLMEKFPGIPLYPAGEKSKVSAGWLIEKAGWKGFRDGDAGVYDRQALVLVNHGGASGKEILALAEKIILDVYEKFGVRLEPEVNIL